MSTESINRGTGAGGKKTNENGLTFENKTSIEDTLIKKGFKRHEIKQGKKSHNPKTSYYFESKIDGKTIIYMTKYGLHFYFKHFYGIDVHRQPDEAFLIIDDDFIHLKILEKKTQRSEGSVDNKILSGGIFQLEYSLILEELNEHKELLISYALCLDDFFKEKLTSDKNKYKIWNKINSLNRVKIFYGNDEKYFDDVYEWINEH